MKNKKTEYALCGVLGILITVMLWITLISRKQGFEHIAYMPFWSYIEIFHCNINIFVEVIANILLFVPAGFLVSRLFNFSRRQITIYAAVGSLIIEVIQFCCCVGSFETDDIINNAIGALIGWSAFIKLYKNDVCSYLSTKEKKLLVFKFFIISLLISVGCYHLNSYLHYQKMVALSVLNNKDGIVENLLVLRGDSGYINNTDVYVKYLNDGSVHIFGKTDYRGWKSGAIFQLPAGNYIITGLKDVEKETIAIELAYYNKNENKYIQLVKDVGPVNEVPFTLEQETDLQVYFKVYEGAEIDVITRPAIYATE